MRSWCSGCSRERGWRDRACGRSSGRWRRHATRAARGRAGDGPRGDRAGRPAADRLRPEAACRSPAPRVRIFLLVAVLSYSRRLFVKAFLNERQDDWREGIAAAFTHFGGVPRTLLGDNARALVLGRDRATGTVSFHPAYLAFCRDWDVQPRACAPYRARTKGKTEAGVKYVKRNALADQAFDSFGRARAAPGGVDGRSPISARHGTTREAPIVRFERDERAALRPLPIRALPRRTQRLRRRVALDAFVDVDTVRYSVPHRLVRDHVEVVVEEQTRPDLSRHRAGRDARAIARAVCARGRPGALRRACGARRWTTAPRPQDWPLSATRPRRLRRGRGRWPMSVVIHARVVEQLTRLRLGYVAERLDAVLNDAARDRADLSRFPRRRPAAGGRCQAADPRRDGPQDRALPDGEDARRLRFQIPAVGRSATRPRARDRRAFSAQAENVLIFGAPGVGKTHLAIALGRAVVEAGHSVLFTSATALLAALSKAETDGQLSDRLMFYTKPKLLIIDELGYLPFERRSAHLFFQLVARRYERGSLLITTNQVVTQWGAVFGDDVLAAAILDRLLHHSHTLMIQGESYRLRQKKKAGLERCGTTADMSQHRAASDVGARRRCRLALIDGKHRD